jgi:hypothetical protein
VRAQLLLALPSGSPAAANDRHQHEPHRVSLHFTLAVTDKPNLFLWGSETSKVSALGLFSLRSSATIFLSSRQVLSL